MFIENPGEYIEFTINTTAFVVGVSYDNAPAGNWDTEDFAYYFPAGTTYTRSENSWQTFTTPAWTAGSIMRIEINTGGFIEFYQDGDLLRTSTATVTAPLYPFASSGVTGGNFTNYQVCK